jgi:hypothetical protein
MWKKKQSVLWGDRYLWNKVWHLPVVFKTNLTCENISELPEKVRPEVWFDGDTELFNAEFVQSISLVKGMSVQVQNYQIPYFPVDNVHLMYNAHPIFFRSHEPVV